MKSLERKEREIVIFSFQIHQYLLGNYFLQIESNQWMILHVL
jgi:hypothetical protein